MSKSTLLNRMLCTMGGAINVNVLKIEVHNAIIYLFVRIIYLPIYIIETSGKIVKQTMVVALSNS